MHRLFEVDGVQDFQLVTVLQEGVPALDHDTAFRIGDDIGAVALKQVGLEPKPGLTAAGAAHHQHIFVPGVLGVRWTIAHH